MSKRTSRINMTMACLLFTLLLHIKPAEGAQGALRGKAQTTTQTNGPEKDQEMIQVETTSNESPESEEIKSSGSEAKLEVASNSIVSPYVQFCSKIACADYEEGGENPKIIGLLRSAGVSVDQIRPMLINNGLLQNKGVVGLWRMWPVDVHEAGELLGHPMYRGAYGYRKVTFPDSVQHIVTGSIGNLLRASNEISLPGSLATINKAVLTIRDNATVRVVVRRVKDAIAQTTLAMHIKKKYPEKIDHHVDAATLNINEFKTLVAGMPTYKEYKEMLKKTYILQKIVQSKNKFIQADILNYMFPLSGKV